MALSPCGDYLVYSSEGEYFALDLTPGGTTQLVEAPSGAGQVLAVAETFVRGDVDGDGRVGSDDLIGLLIVLFIGGSLDCPDAADADDDGVVNFRDFLVSLIYLVQPGSYLPPPFPDPGLDPTPDDLFCCR